MRRPGCLLVWILFLVFSAHAFFLYADEGASGLTGRWGPRASAAVFRDNPSLLGKKRRLGALYAKKYGFDELALKTLACSFGSEGLRWGILVRQFQSKPLQENEALLALSYPLAEGFRGGISVKCLYGILLGESFPAFSWDLGFAWTHGCLGAHVSLLNGEHPMVREEIAHTIVAGAAYRKAPLHLFIKGVSQQDGVSYGVISFFYDLTTLLSMGYGVNTGNGEHRCVVDITHGPFSLELAYVVPRILNHYVSTEVSVTW
ncbi:MAG TPA: hypothetical protein PLJ93_03390 [Candidatus Mcinerneyibacteriales bacterium]|nr:hypothetical protein [Candidatus Mcinerneyibacteriales bacterium]